MGAVIANANASFNPNKLFRTQTWVRWAKGQTLVGVNESDSSFSTVGKTGGAKTHKLTTSEMPSHTHNMDGTIWSDGSGSKSAYTFQANRNATTRYTDSTGGSAAHNNLQPYVTVYYWKRTA